MQHNDEDKKAEKRGLEVSRCVGVCRGIWAATFLRLGPRRRTAILDAEVGLDDLAGAKFFGFEDHFCSGVLEVLEIGAQDTLELHFQHTASPIRRPCRRRFADDRVERMAADLIGEAWSDRGLGTLDRPLQDLQVA